MEKITNGHPLTQSPDFVKENIETLKKLFPTIVKEGKIDIEELQALLGNEVETQDEYYRFTWAGKSMARKEANKPSTGTLRPNKADSKDWDTTQNIFIEGDNLEALKLLQKSYNGKIKVVCIDPPYNTGNDFVYKDNYADNLNNYLSITGQLDEEGKKNSTNSESDGRYHSNWLNMMYPRLKLARNLMTEDGVIFISIDDNEVTNLKKVCDEVFGEDNFIAQAGWQKVYSPKNQAKHLSNDYEYVLMYCSNILKFKVGLLPRTKEMNLRYTNIDNDPRGDWKPGDLVAAEERKGGHYIVKNPVTGKEYDVPSGKHWAFSEDKMKEMLLENRIFFGKNNDSFPSSKQFLKEVKQGRVPSSLLTYKDYGHTDEAKKDFIKLFGEEGKSIFETLKPVRLIENLCRIADVKENDYIIDFFGGSGTTAQAVMNFNSKERKGVKFILVQIPEQTDEKSEAYKAGYKTIAEITKARIKRAGVKIVDEKVAQLQELKGKLLVVQEKIKEASKNKLALNNDTKIETLQESETTFNEQINNVQFSIDNLDTGFRAFKLDSSNINSWDGNPENLEANILNSVNNIKANRSEDDVLYEILLKYGLDLSLPIEEKVIEGKTVFNVGMGSLFICLADGITTSVAEGIGAWKKEEDPATCRVLFKDTGFTDVEKTNSIQVLKHYGITEVNSI